MKTVCIYHRIDLDGWMSAAIVKLWFEKQYPNSCYYNVNTQEAAITPPDIEWSGNSLDFIGFNYGDPIPDLSQYDKVIMCDISFPAKEMINIAESKIKGNFIYIDHHISAIHDIKLVSRHGNIPFIGLQDTNYAACELTWKYFFPNDKMPEVVRLLGRYDCFGHKGTDEERKVLEFQYGARQVITNYEDAYNWLQDGILHSLTTINRIHTQGEAIYQYLCTEAKQAYKNGFKIGLGQSSVKLVDLATIPDTEPETLKNAVGTFLPYKFICINKERFNPINFGIDYHKDGYDGCACFHYANGIYNFSLYNDNGIVDCSQIAKTFGGGGHRGAAGFVLTQEQFNNLIKQYD